MNRYEAMFLFDSSVAHEWAMIETEVKRLFERIDTTPIVCIKFDERRLAYEIERRKRGTYVLTYFDGDPTRIGELERDARLSELVLRLLVLRVENLTEERLTELKGLPADVAIHQPTEERGGRRDRFDGPPSRGRPPRPERSEDKPRATSSDKPSATTGDKPSVAAVAEAKPEAETTAAPSES